MFSIMSSSKLARYAIAFHPSMLISHNGLYVPFREMQTFFFARIAEQICQKQNFADVIASEIFANKILDVCVGQTVGSFHVCRGSGGIVAGVNATRAWLWRIGDFPAWGWRGGLVKIPGSAPNWRTRRIAFARDSDLLVILVFFNEEDLHVGSERYAREAMVIISRKRLNWMLWIRFCITNVKIA